jgi:hypothetical protein
MVSPDREWLHRVDSGRSLGRAELTGPAGSGHSPTSAEVPIYNLWRPVSITV